MTALSNIEHLTLAYKTSAITIGISAFPENEAERNNNNDKLMITMMIK